MKTVVVDQSDWGRIRVTGDDRVRFIQGLCTSNVETLPVGGWLRTTSLSAKARVVAVFEVIKEDDHLLLVCEPPLTDKIVETFERFAIVDDVEFAIEAGPMHRVWDSPAAVWTARPVMAPAVGAASVDEVEVRRIEAGLPRYGVDVGEDNFPFETPLARDIDYAKGCYIGQEPVARVKSRGGAQKTLRGLAIEGTDVVAAGTEIASDERPRAGIVTSAALSPEFGSIALAYLHRSVWEPGTELELGKRRARVVELPFGD